MDSSSDAMMATMMSRRGTGKAVVTPPSILRSSRSMEHRSPSDALLERFPSYKDENEGLQSLREELQDSSEHTTNNGHITNNGTLTPPPAQRKPVALQYANQIAGRDILADLPASYMERKEAERNHIIMLNL